MSKTVDDLVKIMERVSSDFYSLPADLPVKHLYQAQVVAVVRALRDEMFCNRPLRSASVGHHCQEVFNEILGSDAGAGKVAGVAALEDAGAGLSPASGQTPATAPAPAVCVWYLLERKQGIATWSSDHRWHAFFAYEKAPLLCDECGLPIKFTEAK